MKKLLILLLVNLVFVSCTKPETVEESLSPLIGKWQKSRQIGAITIGGKTTSLSQDISSQGAYYEFKSDGSYTESFFDSTAANQPNRLTNGRYTVNADELRLVVDNTKDADIKYLQVLLNDNNRQLYLTDTKDLRLRAINEQSKLDAQLAKTNSDKLQGIDELDVLYRLQKQ